MTALTRNTLRSKGGTPSDSRTLRAPLPGAPRRDGSERSRFLEPSFLAGRPSEPRALHRRGEHSRLGRIAPGRRSRSVVLWSCSPVVLRSNALGGPERLHGLALLRARCGVACFDGLRNAVAAQSEHNGLQSLVTSTARSHRSGNASTRVSVRLRL